MPMAVVGVGFQKLMQLGSLNLTQKCCKMSPGNPLIFGSKSHR